MARKVALGVGAPVGAGGGGPGGGVLECAAWGEGGDAMGSMMEEVSGSMGLDGL